MLPQSQGFKLAVLILRIILIAAQTIDLVSQCAAKSSSNAFAFRSRVSNPSENHA